MESVKLKLDQSPLRQGGTAGRRQGCWGSVLPAPRYRLPQGALQVPVSPRAVSRARPAPLTGKGHPAPYAVGKAASCPSMEGMALSMRLSLGSALSDHQPAQVSALKEPGSSQRGRALPALQLGDCLCCSLVFGMCGPHLSRHPRACRSAAQSSNLCRNMAGSRELYHALTWE